MVKIFDPRHCLTLIVSGKPQIRGDSLGIIWQLEPFQLHVFLRHEITREKILYMQQAQLSNWSRSSGVTATERLESSCILLF